MKVQVRRFEFKTGGTRITIKRGSQQIFKRTRTSKINALWLRDGLHCTCGVIKSAKTRILVTGWQMGRRLVLNSIIKWSRRSKKLMQRLRRRRCPKRHY